MDWSKSIISNIAERIRSVRYERKFIIAERTRMLRRDEEARRGKIMRINIERGEGGGVGGGTGYLGDRKERKI